MRVVFYLPVVTSWWFDCVVEPLIRVMARDCEVHVLAPAPWRGTGIGERELARCADLADVRWAIMDGDDHPSTRTVPEAREDIVGYVRSLAPDLVLCRSADYDILRDFPGTVRLLMEGRLEPFATPPGWIAFQDRPFDHGVLPALSDGERAALVRLIEPAWARLEARHAGRAGEREAVFARCGIAGGGPVLLVPLEYEGEENFFGIHRAGAASNVETVRALAAKVGPGFTLALTNHPLNDLNVDSAPLLSAVAGLDNVVLAPPTIGTEPATIALARHCDALVLGDSKTWSLGAFLGKPMLRQSRFESGGWLNLYSEFDAFLPAVAGGAAKAAAREDAMLWFGFHLANELIAPRDPELSAADVIAHARQPIDSGRWEGAIARFRRASPDLFA
jgi:hypothetical protein